MDNTHSLSLVSASSQAVSIANNATLRPTGAFTAEAWIKTSTLGKNFFQSYSRNTNIAGWYFDFASGVPRFICGRNTGATQGTDFNIATAVTNVCNGLWTHIAATYDGSTLKIYVNGNLEGSTAYSGGVAYASGNNVRIGCYNDTGTNGNYFNGQIDEVRLWSVARTQAEIKANMFRDVAGDINLIDSWKLNNNLTSTSGSNNGTAINSPTFTTDTPFPTYTDVSPVALSATTLASDTNLQLHNPFDNNLSDLSPNGNNSTSVGSTSYVTGKFNSGINYPAGGTNYTITNSNLNDGGGLGGSFSFWFKKSSDATERSSFSSESTTGTRWILQESISVNGSMSMGIDQNGVGFMRAVSPGGYFDDTWHHFVGVRDTSGNLYVYIDGLLVASNTGANSIKTNSITASKFIIGNCFTKTTANTLGGSVDDFAFFNRVLTPTEIFELYTGLNRAFTDYTKNLTDSLSLSELKALMTSKPLVASFSLSESLGKAVSRVKSLSDSSTISENYSKRPTKVKTDSATLVDAKSLAQNKPFLESLSVSEVFIHIASLIRQYSDSVGVTSLFTKLSNKAIITALTVSESFSASGDKVKVFAESIVLAEVFDTATALFKSFTEAISTSSIFLKHTTKIKSEGFELTELQIRKTQKNPSDELSLDEEYTQSGFQIRNFLESLSLDELFSSVRSRLFGEAIVMNDSIEKQRSKSLVESITTSEVFTKLRQVPKDFAELITVVSTYAQIKTHTFIDTITTSEVYKMYLNGILVKWHKVARAAQGVWSKIEKTITRTG